ncbi:MAG: YccF domain-containing protein [Elainellaceae cyanobacterium]
MSLLGNIIWLVFGGFFTGIGYIFGGALVCLTIVGIPFGLQAIKLGFASFTPFGKEIVEDKGADSTLKLVFDILWVILFGWEIAIAHLTAAAILAITIIGLPFAKQHMKLIILAFLPFGRDLRPIQQSESLG